MVPEVHIVRQPSCTGRRGVSRCLAPLPRPRRLCYTRCYMGEQTCHQPQTSMSRPTTASRRCRRGAGFGECQIGASLPKVTALRSCGTRDPPIWRPFAVGAMAAFRTPNCDYAARSGDALRIAVALVPVSDAAGRRVPARTGRRGHCRRTPPLAAAVVAAGPSAGQTTGPTARGRSRGLPARRGCVAGLARLVDAQPAPMMTIFDLMVRVPAERMAARLRPLV